MGKKPERFHVSIGGYLGPSYVVQLVQGELQYKSCEPKYTNWKAATIPVTDEQWAAFQAVMDSLGVWAWKKEYPNPEVCDGTQWSVEIAYSDRVIESHGDNNYPGRSHEQSRVFKRFKKAIRALIGSRAFA